MHGRVAVREAFDSTTSTGEAFERELRKLLLHRARLIFFIGLVSSAVLIGIYDLVIGVTPELDTVLPRHALRFAYPIAFALALGATYVFAASARALRNLVFAVLALIMIAAIVNIALFAPGQQPYLILGFTLFAYAAFIPSRAIYTGALAALALLTFVLATTLAYAFDPQTRAFWQGFGGARAMRGSLTMGASGIAVFGLIAYAISRTLYGLRRTAHQAERLGNYYIEQELGSGGMGKVFRARHALIRRPTAVKVMQVVDDETAAAVTRFEREVQLCATLSHPNTITIYDFGRTPDDRFYYVMEFLDGLDLQEVVDRFGPMPASRAVYILRQVCGALAEAHKRGVIHRDIKPSNIFLTERGGLYDFVKVLDFGLAKQFSAEEDTSITATGVALGTPRYMSPEAAKGASVLDGRSDIYCLGAVAYWMLTGRPPFDSGSAVELLVDHIKAVPTPPTQVSELEIPTELETIVMRCLEKTPGERFQSAEQLRDALDALRFRDPWTQEAAREWWSLHGLLAPPEAAAAVESDPSLSRFIYEP